MKPMNSFARIGSSPNACTDCTTPERVMNVPKIVRKNVDDDQDDVPDAQHAAPLLHHHGVQKRRRREPRQQRRVLDRVPRPVAAPAELFVRPDHPEHQAERQEQPAEHRPAAHGAQPRIVQMTGDERRDAERERNRHADEARVERRRMNRHVDVLQQRVEPCPSVGAAVRYVVNGFLCATIRIEKEHLHGRDGGDDVGDELAVALAVHVDRQRSEDRQQEHPEHDRAVEAAPVRRDLVEQRLHAVRVVHDVLDRVVARSGTR